MVIAWCFGALTPAHLIFFFSSVLVCWKAALKRSTLHKTQYYNAWPEESKGISCCIFHIGLYCGIVLLWGWLELAVTKVTADLWPLEVTNPLWALFFQWQTTFHFGTAKGDLAPNLSCLKMLLQPQIASELLLQSWWLLWCLYIICLFIGFLVTHVCKAHFTTGSNICLLPVIAFVEALIILRPLAKVSLSWMELAKPSLIPSFCWFTESRNLCFALTV